jgi:hypothetical protein
MALLFSRVFIYTGIVYFLCLLAMAIVSILTQPLSNLTCDVRTNWSDYDPLVYPVQCTSKEQVFFAFIANLLSPLTLAIWLFLSFVIFIFAVIFVALTYKPGAEQ